MITTIAFDVGGVLVTNGKFPQSVLMGLVYPLHLPLQTLLPRYDKLLPQMEENKAPLSILPIQKIGKLKELYQNVAQKTFSLNRELLDIAIRLKTNYQVGIISNIDKYLAEIPIHQQVYSNFDPNLVVLSWQVKIRKPNRKIYEIFLRKANAKAEECLFVDNDIVNIKTAKDMGMLAILFKNNTQANKELEKYL